MVEGRSPDTIEAVLRRATSRLKEAGIENAEADTRQLLMDVTGLDRAAIITNSRADFESSHIAKLNSLLERRAAGEPLAYVLGKTHFWTLELSVSPDTLIPRPETERVVSHALDAIAQIDTPRILDLGTGSGAILLALLSERSKALGMGVDISPDALNIAKDNARTHNLTERVRFVQSDLFEEITDRYDLIVANPPYIKRSEIDGLDLSVRGFEPHLALDGGEDGLDFYRRIAQGAKEYLSPKGAVVMEIGYDQGPSVVSLMVNAGFPSVRLNRDLSQQNRIVTAML